MNYKNNLRKFVIVAGLFALVSTVCNASVSLSGDLKKWHKVTLTFDGPKTSEDAIPNPFLDYRLLVTFKNGSKTVKVPGYYAADGEAGETSATAGDKWRVNFSPDLEGDWNYQVSFRTGKDVALSAEPNAGDAGPLDGLKGTFKITPIDKAMVMRLSKTGCFEYVPDDKASNDYRVKGMLRYAGGHYLQFAQTGEYFLKAGTDSPENFLGYADFDGTFDTGAIPGPNEGADTEFIHKYGPHAADWKKGDPTWKKGKGKNIIGALNYLASKRVNSVYFLTYNIDGGDGKDTWPWTDPNEKFRFDCSKLDQWEIVFSHMDKLGIMLHVVTQETENDQGLDGGELGIQRKLYYRELIARFAHHTALVWNLGEENTNTNKQRADFCKFIRDLDPYDHPIVVHTFPGQYDAVYKPLLDIGNFEGPSLQMGDVKRTHPETLKWVKASDQGLKWVVCLDEIGPADTGVVPDINDLQHDNPRKFGLWGNLMAGGGGCEWYFGYKYPNNDRTCEDFRSRERMWDLTRYAVDFFKTYLPFSEMTPNDKLLSNGWCLAKEGEIYCVYLLQAGGGANLRLGEGTYSIEWFNPRKGGPLVKGMVEQVDGPGEIPIGQPPDEMDKDWVVLVRIKK